MSHPAAAEHVVIEAAEVRKSFGATEVLRGVSLSLAAGRVLALLGPSGCGKTTLLRCLAGLEDVEGGEIRLHGRLVSAAGVHVPPEQRGVGMVFQDWALFPHLTVTKNVAYGLSRATRRSERVAQALELVGLAHLGDRLPGTLSGGQQQRVALARALAPQPSLLLLDEPFSNLDATLRVQVRGEVHSLLASLDVTTVFVTHDQEEAFVLGDEVAVMRAGELVQQGTPDALYTAPTSRWVAAFVGDANLVPGEARGRTAETALGPVPLRDEAAGPVHVLVRPEHVVLADAADAGGDGGGGVGQVELVEYHGHDTVYLVGDGAVAGLKVRGPSPPAFSRGARVTVRYAGPATTAFPSTGAPESGP